MRSPDYGELLRTFWNKSNSTAPVAQETEDRDLPSADVDIADLLGESIMWQTTIAGQLPLQQPVPGNLPKELIAALATGGITQLYSHQIEAIEAIRAKKDLIITTPTASGKTLSIYPAILEGCINSGERCLSFYPLKALASDQFHKLEKLTRSLPKHCRPRLAMLTGDITTEERNRLLASRPHIIGATPELIHFQLRSSWRSEAWLDFWRRLRYICLDEAHTLTGPLGASMALLLRRIKLKVDAAGGDSRKLQFLILSATAGNPIQLAQQLSQRNKPERLVWIDKSGAASPEKRLLVLHPSAQPNPDAARIVIHLMQQGLSGITFCNSRAAVKSLLGIIKAEADRLGYPGTSDKLAMFYGSLTSDRRTEIIKALETGKLKGFISTSALEAGIDLPSLDYAIIRGWPGSLMSFRQRIGRAGRAKTGLAIFLPIQSPLDNYFSAYPEALITGDAEQVSFNSEYPILLAKHLLCAATESGIPTDKIKRYFGSTAPRVVTALMQQDQIFKGRNGLWARGFPHKHINFRGGITQKTIKLIDADSKEEFEQLNEDAAMREVYPGAIYRCQSPDGQIVTFISTSLDLDSLKATMKQIGSTPKFTVAITDSQSKTKDRLTDPIQFPVVLQAPDLSKELDRNLPQIQLELAWGEINQMVIGSQLLTKQYVPTCFNRKCLKHNVPLPNRSYCPDCNKRTLQTELVTVIEEASFPEPYKIKFSTPVVEVSLTPQVRDNLKAIASQIKKSLIKENDKIPPGYQTLWEANSSFIALHSFGHQLMAALPLVVLSSSNDLNYVVERVSEGVYIGRFYDTTDGGNGASEAIFQNFQELASRAAQLARSCDCLTGCPKCLQQHNCPQGNKALLKQLGLVLLEAIALK